MGTFNFEIEIGDPDGERFEPVNALADSGSTYTFVPSTLLDGLGVSRNRTMTFRLADGSRIVRHVGYTWAKLNGMNGTTPVIFGDDSATPLLGSVTLENFGLEIDSANERLVEINALL